MSGNDKHAISLDEINRAILVFRGQKVILDSTLASLYQVEVKALNQAVKRNLDRFPADFMFQLSQVEVDSIRSQSVTLERGRGQHSKYRPHVFTEQGVAMLSSVLRSKRAILVNIEIMRAFVHLRRFLLANKVLEQKLDALERKYDGKFKIVFDTIRALMDAPSNKTKRPIGFAPWEE